jgi:hypothetical protein
MKQIARLYYAMLPILWAALYRAIYAIDNALGNVTPYAYETAPFCGHHYSGHEGRLTTGNYHEGIGGCQHKNRLFVVGICSEEGPFFNWTRRIEVNPPKA